MLPDCKILAAGYVLKFAVDNYPPYDGDIVLARFNADGTPDASFGNKGVVITNFGEYETTEAMAVAPDGTLDNSFGKGGKQVIQVGAAFTEAKTVLAAQR